MKAKASVLRSGRAVLAGSALKSSASDLALPLLAVVMGLAALGAKGGVEERAARFGNEEPLGPGAFLALLGWGLVATGVALAAQILYENRVARTLRPGTAAPPGADVCGGTARSGWAAIVVVAGLLALLCVMALLIQHGGIITGMLLVLGLGTLLISRSIRGAIASAVFGTAGLYLIFVTFLEVPLPLGSLR